MDPLRVVITISPSKTRVGRDVAAAAQVPQSLPVFNIADHVLPSVTTT